MNGYIVYFEPVMIKAENKEEAEKLAKKYVSIDFIEEE